MKNTSRISKGLTLVEVLVATAVFGLIVTVIYSFLAAGMRYFALTRNSVNAQQQAQLATINVSRDLSESSGNSVVTYTSGTHPGLVFASPRYPSWSGSNPNQFAEDPNTGTPIWEKFVGYYVDADLQSPGVLDVVRAEFVPNGYTASNVASSTGVTPDDLSAGSGVSTIVKKIVARNVASFLVTASGSPGSYSMVVTTTDGGASRPTTNSIETAVTLFN